MSLIGLFEARDLSKADLVLERDGLPQDAYESKDRSITGKAEALRTFLANLNPGPGCEVILGPGDWHFGMAYMLMPQGVILGGRGKGKTRLISNQELQANFCGFELSRGLSLRKMTLKWDSRDGKTRGGQTLGIARDGLKNMPPVIATCSELEVVSYGACALYFWGSGSGHKCRFDDCTFSAGRWAGCIGAGSGDDSAILEFNRCQFNADFAQYGGAGGDMGTPSNTAGFVVRGGQCVMNDCEVNVKGYAGNGIANDPNGPPFEYAIGVTASSLGSPSLPKWSYAWPYLTLNRTKVTVEPNGAKRAIDVWGYNGTTKVNGGKGSNADGSFVVEGSVAIAP